MFCFGSSSRNVGVLTSTKAVEVKTQDILHELLKCCHRWLCICGDRARVCVLQHQGCEACVPVWHLQCSNVPGGGTGLACLWGHENGIQLCPGTVQGPLLCKRVRVEVFCRLVEVFGLHAKVTRRNASWRRSVRCLMTCTAVICASLKTSLHSER